MKGPALAIALGAAACGGAVPAAAPPGGCPTALGVAQARWDDGDARTPAGYRVLLGWRAADAPDAPPVGEVPGYVLARLGLGPLPAAVWLLRPARPPCTAAVASYQADAAGDGVVLTARLDGCKPDDVDDLDAPAWASLVGADPDGCQLEPATATSGPPVHADAGPVEPDGALPAAWAAALAVPPCEDADDADDGAAAGCARRWSAVTVAGPPAITEVRVTDGCGAEAIARGGVLGGDALLTTAPGLALVGALVDPRGGRVALLAGATRWAAIDVAADGRGGARREVSYLPDELAPAEPVACPAP